jgi:hypothetical protein
MCDGVELCRMLEWKRRAREEQETAMEEKKYVNNSSVCHFVCLYAHTSAMIFKLGKIFSLLSCKNKSK